MTELPTACGALEELAPAEQPEVPAGAHPRPAKIPVEAPRDPRGAPERPAREAEREPTLAEEEERAIVDPHRRHDRRRRALLRLARHLAHQRGRVAVDRPVIAAGDVERLPLSDRVDSPGLVDRHGDQLLAADRRRASDPPTPVAEDRDPALLADPRADEALATPRAGHRLQPLDPVEAPGRLAAATVQGHAGIIRDEEHHAVAPDRVVPAGERGEGRRRGPLRSLFRRVDGRVDGRRAAGLGARRCADLERTEADRDGHQGRTPRRTPHHPPREELRVCSGGRHLAAPKPISLARPPGRPQRTKLQAVARCRRVSKRRITGSSSGDAAALPSP